MTIAPANPATMDAGQAVVDIVNAVCAADSRDWAACRTAFADRIHLDHDSDGAAGTVAADDVITGWQRIWQHFTVTFHEVTNHRVDLGSDQARCRSYVRALHVGAAPIDGENTYTTFGHYDDRLVRTNDGWKICSRDYRQIFATGNPAVFPPQ